MSNALLRDAFAHNVWPTLRILDACLALNPEQLKTAVPGTYGSILDTARHLVGADYGYLFVLTGERMPMLDEEQMTLEELRAVAERNGAATATKLKYGAASEAGAGAFIKDTLAQETEWGPREQDPRTPTASSRR